MAVGPEDTRRDVAAVNAKLAARCDVFAKVLVAEAADLLITGTPVDTGNCAGNWNIAAGAEDNTYVEGRLNPSRAVPEVPPIRAGEVVYLINATPYVERLEYGHHSKQAPSGWVRTSAVKLMQRAGQLAERIRREFGG